jgi:hypothetical protein
MRVWVWVRVGFWKHFFLLFNDWRHLHGPTNEHALGAGADHFDLTAGIIDGIGVSLTLLELQLGQQSATAIGEPDITVRQHAHTPYTPDCGGGGHDIKELGPFPHTGLRDRA